MDSDDARQRRLNKRIGVAIWVAVVLLAFSRFINLGAGDLKDWDECLYAWRAKIICFGYPGAWLDQSPLAWDGFYSAAFPPLQIWATAIFFKVFGFTEFAARIWSALAGAGSVIVLFLMGRRLGRCRWTGLLAALLLNSVWYYTVYSRRAQFDVPQAFWIMASLYGYIGYLDRIRIIGRRRIEIGSGAIWWLVGAGTALGLGLMNKIAMPLMAPIFMGLLSLYSWIRGRHSFRRIVIEQVIVNGVALAIMLPWHLAVALGPRGEDFLRYYFGYHLVGRSTTILERHAGAWYFYFVELWTQSSHPLRALTLIAAPAFLLAIARSFRSGRDEKESQPWGDEIADAQRPWRHCDLRYLLPLLWLGSQLALFSLIPTKRDTYTIAMYPPLALMAALFLGERLRDRSRPLLPGVSLFIVGAFCLFSRMRSFGRMVDLLMADLSKIGWFTDVLAQLGGILGGLALAIAVLYIALRHKPEYFHRATMASVLALTVVFCLRPARAVFDPDRGTRDFGWQKVRPYLDSLDYDRLILIGDYPDPASYYYFNGLQLGWRDDIAFAELPHFDPAKMADIGELGRSRIVIMKWLFERKWPEPERQKLLDRLQLLADGEYVAIYDPKKP